MWQLHRKVHSFWARSWHAPVTVTQMRQTIKNKQNKKKRNEATETTAGSELRRQGLTTPPFYTAALVAAVGFWKFFFFSGFLRVCILPDLAAVDSTLFFPGKKWKAERENHSRPEQFGSPNQKAIAIGVVMIFYFVFLGHFFRLCRTGF